MRNLKGKHQLWHSFFHHGTPQQLPPSNFTVLAHAPLEIMGLHSRLHIRPWLKRWKLPGVGVQSPGVLWPVGQLWEDIDIQRWMGQQLFSTKNPALWNIIICSVRKFHKRERKQSNWRVLFLSPLANAVTHPNPGNWLKKNLTAS